MKNMQIGPVLATSTKYSEVWEVAIYKTPVDIFFHSDNPQGLERDTYVMYLRLAIWNR